MSDLQLSPHFSLREMLFSDTAARMGIENVPTDEQIRNATRLCQVLLEPMRIELGRPMTVLSGIRTARVNALVGGAPYSAHLDGRAADVLVAGMSPDTFARWIRQRGYPVDQVISEFGRWTHIAMAGAGKPRNQYLTATKVNGATRYEVLA